MVSKPEMTSHSLPSKAILYAELQEWQPDAVHFQIHLSHPCSSGGVASIALHRVRNCKTAGTERYSKRSFVHHRSLPSRCWFDKSTQIRCNLFYSLPIYPHALPNRVDLPSLSSIKIQAMHEDHSCFNGNCQAHLCPW